MAGPYGYICYNSIVAGEKELVLALLISMISALDPCSLVLYLPEKGHLVVRVRASVPFRCDFHAFAVARSTSRRRASTIRRMPSIVSSGFIIALSSRGVQLAVHSANPNTQELKSLIPVYRVLATSHSYTLSSSHCHI